MLYPMKVFLTGATGFIGFHTVKRLLAENHQVIAIDNINDYYSPVWKKENLAELEKLPNFTFQELDILDLVKLKALVKHHSPEAIIHLAARAGVRPSIEQPLLYTQVNILGTQHVLEIARELKIGRVVYASSSSVYGNQEKVPFSETDPCVTPISPYAATKRATELIAHTYSHLFGLETVGLRFFTVYGPNGRPDMAPYLFTQAILKDQPIKQYGDGTTARDYTYVDDIVSGIVASITASLPNKAEIINLGNNQPVQLKDFIKTLEMVTGKTAKIVQQPLQPGDVQQTYADITKAQKILNYQPKTSLKKGLTQFVAWYKANRL